MKKLVARFQRDLQISESNATFRVFGVLTLVLLAISTLIASLLIFPYRQSRIDTIVLPKGDYYIASSMPDSNRCIIIKTNYGELEKLHSGPIYITNSEGQVALIKVIDERTVTYCNIKTWFSIMNLSYVISSIEKVKDCVAYIKYERQTTEMIILNIVIPLLFIIIFLLLIIGMQSRAGVYSMKDSQIIEKNLVVWFKEKN